MADALCLAIDTMGGDFGPRVTVPATFDVLRVQPQLSVVLLGNENEIISQLPSDHDSFQDRVRIQHCEQTVAMDEKPSRALRHKRNSSMWQSIALVSEKNADAVVSAGNTGALMTMSLLQLRAQPGISRPAICTKVPTATGFTYLLDMGANLECSSNQLYQFALMANQVALSVDGIASPRVSLLNIGSEEIKGHAEIRETAEMLEQNPSINYIGYIEGDGLFSGRADIVVCDGFIGNIALKTAEGAAKLFSDSLETELRKSLLGRIAGFLATPSLKTLSNRLSPATYNGASMLGLRGTVVKSHGSADQLSFSYAIKSALKEASLNLPGLIGTTLISTPS